MKGKYIGKNHPMYGKHMVAWNKGLPMLKKTKQKLKGINLGKKQSPETIEKRRLKMIGHFSWSKGKKFPKELYPNFGARGMIFPFKDTKIELKIQNILKLLHIEFLTHYYISDITHSYRCDILIPSTKTIIETDGCYWHGCPICKIKTNNKVEEQIKEDKIRTKELQEKGYKVIRIWEHDIKKMEVNSFREKLEINQNDIQKKREED